jgi:hypothetical protein
MQQEVKIEHNTNASANTNAKAKVKDKEASNTSRKRGRPPNKAIDKQQLAPYPVQQPPEYKPKKISSKLPKGGKRTVLFMFILSLYCLFIFVYYSMLSMCTSTYWEME